MDTLPEELQCLILSQLSVWGRLRVGCVAKVWHDRSLRSFLHLDLVAPPLGLSFAPLLRLGTEGAPDALEAALALHPLLAAMRRAGTRVRSLRASTQSRTLLGILLARFPEINSLDLIASDISGDSEAPLLSCSSLHELRLQSYSQRTLSADWARLTSLSFILEATLPFPAPPLDPLTLAAISSASRLVSLRISAAPDLRELKQLQRLGIRVSTPADLSQLQGCTPSLELLEVHYASPALPLPPLERFGRLTSLTLTSAPPLSPETLSPLSLTSLCLVQVPASTLHLASEQRWLRRLDLRAPTSSPFTPSDLAALAFLPSLTSLRLEGAFLPGNGLTVVSSLTSLLHLSLKATQPLSLPPLCLLPLLSLRLAPCDIPDTLFYLEGLQRLQRLHLTLGGARLKEASFASLGGLKALRRLSLGSGPDQSRYATWQAQGGGIGEDEDLLTLEGVVATCRRLGDLERLSLVHLSPLLVGGAKWLRAALSRLEHLDLR